MYIICVVRYFERIPFEVKSRIERYLFDGDAG